MHPLLGSCYIVVFGYICVFVFVFFSFFHCFQHTYILLLCLFVSFSSHLSLLITHLTLWKFVPRAHTLFNFRAFLAFVCSTIRMHVHNVIILHNVLCSVFVFCGYTFLSFAGCSCFFFVLLLFSLVVTRFFFLSFFWCCCSLIMVLCCYWWKSFVCMFHSLSIYLLQFLFVHHFDYYFRIETACKIHSECITFFREFEMWFESRICWNMRFHRHTHTHT